MIAADTTRLALRNLGQAKLRTSLTVLGVSIGIASLSGMISLGVGLQDQVVGRLTKSGIFDQITVSESRSLLGRMGGRGPLGRGAANRPAGIAEQPVAPLDDAAIKNLGALPNVRDVYPTLRVPAQVTIGAFTEFSTLAGIPMSAKDEGVFQTMSAGTFFPNDADDTCILSLDFAKRAAGSRDPKELVGQTLTITYATAPAGTDQPNAMQLQRVEAHFTIAGIVERDPSPFGGLVTSGVMLPVPKIAAIDAVDVSGPQAMLRPSSGTKSYNAVTVKVTQAKFTQDVEDKIKGMGYTAFSLNDLLQGAKRGFIVIDIMLSLIGSIALAVSSLGIVNTMVMSILERTREIGVMKAIGGSDGDVRKIFLVEASVIGVLGGTLGIMLGWTVGRIINFFANMYIKSQGGQAANLFSLPLWLIASAIGFSVLVSLIAGSYPASRAAKLDPIQALRHD